MQMRTHPRHSKEACWQPGSHPLCPAWTALWSPGTARPQRVDLGAQVMPWGPRTSNMLSLDTPAATRWQGLFSLPHSLSSSPCFIPQGHFQKADPTPTKAPLAMLRAPHCSEHGTRAFTHLLIDTHSPVEFPTLRLRTKLALLSSFSFLAPVLCTQQVPKQCLLHPVEDGKVESPFPPCPTRLALRWTHPGCPVRP